MSNYKIEELRAGLSYHIMQAYQIQQRIDELQEQEADDEL